MITIFFPGHPSHFDGKFGDAEIKEGLDFLAEHYPKPPFTRSKIVILREPGNLQATSDDVPKEAPSTAAGKRTAGLWQSDLAYCEQWRVKRVKEMVDFMTKRRDGGVPDKK
jgi:hypothetical protein